MFFNSYFSKFHNNEIVGGGKDSDSPNGGDAGNEP